MDQTPTGPQRDPSVTPFTGNAVLTTNTITFIVAAIVYLARTKGYEIDQQGQNALIEFLGQPGVGEVLVGAVWGIMTWLGRRRVSSELTVAKLQAHIKQLQARV